MTDEDENQYLNDRIRGTLWSHVESVERGDSKSPHINMTLAILIIRYNARERDKQTVQGYRENNG